MTMAQINRSPVQQRIARGIAIRKRIARGSPSRAAVAAATVAVEPKPIVVILVEDFGTKSGDAIATLHVFDDLEALRVGLALEEVQGLAHEIDEENEDGTVYAAFDPYDEDVRDKRTLIVASSRFELEQRHDVSCGAI
jgi:hypothetical protein